MIVRLWRTGVDTEGLETYRRFAKTRSSPMFALLPGHLGHLFMEATGTHASSANGPTSN